MSRRSNGRKTGGKSPGEIVNWIQDKKGIKKARARASGALWLYRGKNSAEQGERKLK